VVSWRRFLSAQPLTLAYSAVLLGTSVSGQRIGRDRLTERLQRYSTDGLNLRRAPLVVLAGSALFIPSEYWGLDLVFTALALASFERRVGAWATATVFSAGHIGATLATQLPIMSAVKHGVLAESELRRIDVGASFGVYACLGAYAGVVDSRWQKIGLAATVLSLPITGATGGDPIAALGHPAAVLIGMAMWPWLRRRDEQLEPELDQAHDLIDLEPGAVAIP